jgi:uncharacterized protein YprB with RNaseH-like and TPR domain
VLRLRTSDALPPIEQILKGEWLETDCGPVFVRDQWYPLDHAHGAHSLGSALACDEGALSMLLGGAPAPAPERTGFFDIETTGLSGGTGTYVVLAALGTFERAEPDAPLAFRLRQYFLAGLQHEKALITLVGRDLSSCEALVTYNGRSFDVPVMESRFTLARVASPCGGLAHFDLLHAVRRLYAHRMAGCKLADAERRLLRIERPDDVPGHLIPQLYRDYLTAGRASPLRGVFRHNAEDVLSLVAILSSLSGLLSREDHDPDDAIAVARWYERIGDRSRALRMYDFALPWLEGGDDWTWVARRSAMLQKKAGAREDAVLLWTRLWHQGDVSAGLELAKYLEHSARNLDDAERVVRELIAQAGSEVGLLHRLARIQRKAAG